MMGLSADFPIIFYDYCYCPVPGSAVGGVSAGTVVPGSGTVSAPPDPGSVEAPFSGGVVPSVGVVPPSVPSWARGSSVGSGVGSGVGGT